MDGRILSEELDRLNLTVTPETEKKLLHYVSSVERWDRTMNLTNLKGNDLVRRLVAEPLWLGRQLQLSARLMDIGSGNGSPALPLALGLEFTAVHVVESRAKRSVFLRQMGMELGLKQLRVHQSRVEDLAWQTEDAVDWVTMQAVTPNKLILKWLSRALPSTTGVVWITSLATPPVPAAEQAAVPDSATHAWVFRLDQI